jgi:hypothetical protein
VKFSIREKRKQQKNDDGRKERQRRWGGNKAEKLRTKRTKKYYQS